MAIPVRSLKNALTLPRGFRASAVAAGIKYEGRRDVALIVSDVPARAAAVFTTNQVKAWPVQIGQKHMKAACHQAIIANSGNANCSNGRKNYERTKAYCIELARQLGIPPTAVLPSSTGVIGRDFATEKIHANLAALVKNLSRHGGYDAARAIMTTDTRSKEAAVSLVLGGRKVTIAAIAKGAGMLHPHMATMLVFMTTDVAIAKPLLNRALKEVARATFNHISVDNDMSTNDTVVILANGQAGNACIMRDGTEYRRFRDALQALAWHIARELVRDGEGVTKVCELRVSGAKTEREAEGAARAVANSMLFKTALHGADPNWGRIVAAIGSRPDVRFAFDRLTVAIGGVAILRNGKPDNRKLDRVKNMLKKRDVVIDIALGVGNECAAFITSDLSREYIAINADYTT